ncbi:unnamed protein product [Dibothriocephalus latus]|uniref:Uncharacterized protein n=1 Tax=Dibothriocephalus latus TaxID=60516 RepID=A0A3P7NLG5_DIBLA|nr:unnamed protein product [Dibothriocephalus latus]
MTSVTSLSLTWPSEAQGAHSSTRHRHSRVSGQLEDEATLDEMTSVTSLSLPWPSMTQGAPSSTRDRHSRVSGQLEAEANLEEMTSVTCLSFPWPSMTQGAPSATRARRSRVPGQLGDEATREEMTTAPSLSGPPTNQSVSSSTRAQCSGINGQLEDEATREDMTTTPSVALTWPLTTKGVLLSMRVCRSVVCGSLADGAFYTDVESSSILSESWSACEDVSVRSAFHFVPSAQFRSASPVVSCVASSVVYDPSSTPVLDLAECTCLLRLEETCQFSPDVQQLDNVRLTSATTVLYKANFVQVQLCEPILGISLLRGQSRSTSLTSVCADISYACASAEDSSSTSAVCSNLGQCSFGWQASTEELGRERIQDVQAAGDHVGTMRPLNGIVEGAHLGKSVAPSKVSHTA